MERTRSVTQRFSAMDTFIQPDEPSHILGLGPVRYLGRRERASEDLFAGGGGGVGGGDGGGDGGDDDDDDDGEFVSELVLEVECRRV